MGIHHDLIAALSHIRWIGGAPDAGKSSVAESLAEKYQLLLYSFDHRAENVLENYFGRNPAAFIHTWIKLSVDERFVEQSPETQFENILRIERESFTGFLEDLLTMPRESLIVVEGNIVPEVLEPVLSSPRHAIWFVPSDKFKLESFYRRGKNEGHNERSDPAKALHNHLTRDGLFTQRMKEQAQAHHLKFLEIDGSLMLDEVVQITAQHFELEAATHD